jgi:WXG100 family type VII secretion target
MPAIKIKIEFDKVDTISSAFSEQSDTVKQMNSNLSSKYDKLKGGDWVGVGADKFFQEMEQTVMPSLKRLESALSRGSEASKKISQKMHGAEDQCKGIVVKIGINFSIL